MNAALLRFVLCALAVCAASACAPAIGDDCGNALDCSAQGSRLCDRTQPGGYCTIRGCEQGTCPGEAVCVKFAESPEPMCSPQTHAQAERLAVTYCMAKCSGQGDCRSNYRCTSAADFGDRGDAVILGRSTQRFCSIPRALPMQSIAEANEQTQVCEDGGESGGDAGTP